MAPVPKAKWYPGMPEIDWGELKGCSSCPRHDAEGPFDNETGVMKIRCRANPGRLTEVAESEDRCPHRHERVYINSIR